VESVRHTFTEERSRWEARWRQEMEAKLAEERILLNGQLTEAQQRHHQGDHLYHVYDSDSRR
jgi:hypothetical protein